MSLENHLKWLRLETPSNPDARWTGINTAFPGTYQYSVGDWVHECFGPEIAADKQERNHRFIEEALELVQACGATASECHQLVDYVFGRDVGDPAQETGGVMVTLAALCNAHGIDLDKAARDELTRVWTKVDKIRAKQGAKPRHSPLPEAPQADAGGEAERVCHEEQLRVWANELTGGLSLGDFIREDVDYADGVELERIVMHEIKQIVISAFTHPAREALRAAAQEAGG
jgi:NTP pyrophosphatase (non-canonical NTP hydrolase)